MVLDVTLQYKVGIKGKVEQSRERSSALPLHLGVVAIEKGVFGSPATKVANFTYFSLLSVDWENVKLVGWLVFMAYQPLKVIWRLIHFYVYNQFYFKQFSLAWVHSLIVKNISISNYSV